MKTKSESVPQPLRYARKKAVKKRVLDKNFRIHPDDQRYRTLTVPLDIYDVDEIRTFLKKTADLWPQPSETRVVCRLLEAIALNISAADFIGTSSIIPPQRFFEPRATITVGLWIPATIAERLSEMKQQRPKLRSATDTEAVALFLIEAVARYIRSGVVEQVTTRMNVVSVSQEANTADGAVQEELKLLRAMYKTIEADLLRERVTTEATMAVAGELQEQLVDIQNERAACRVELDQEKVKVKVQLREIERLQEANIKMKYAART